MKWVCPNRVYFCSIFSIYKIYEGIGTNRELIKNFNKFKAYKMIVETILTEMWNFDRNLQVMSLLHFLALKLIFASALLVDIPSQGST